MNTFLWVLYGGVTLWSIISIILHGSRPTKSLSWLLAVLLLPFAGPLLYYLFGVNRRKFKFFRLRQTEKRKLFDEKYKDLHELDNKVDFDSKKKEKLSKLIENSTLLAPYGGNKTTVLNGGEETFESIFEALEKAEHFIHLQYYIFSEGELTQKFFEIFEKKIAQGVEVRLIYDSFGSFSFRGKTIKRFRNIGVKAFPMMPIRFGNLLFTLNYRNHRKIIVIDGKVGFTGGVNVSDKYIKPISDLGIWEDLHLKLEGPVVNSLHRIFIKDYHFAGDEELLLSEKYVPKTEPQGNHITQIVAAGPDSKQPAIMQQYIGMINAAEKCISIANPYFIPGRAVLQALMVAALSGIKVNLLVPEESDSKMAKFSMFSRFEQLLAVGVKIYLRPDFSHSKMIQIDNEIASVGSGNFDYRSFEHNFETNALLYDTDLTQQIQNEFDSICGECKSLDYETFKNRPVGQKLLEGLAKFFSPLL
ncbi:cardiolipin synthase [Costertonia aggregata]|uniref:Cardiolipin synthase n=1 Tax=Costertonia aggregata TaxID=343403 RepID=A0A7H9AP01_9FLAO|nr:cardiolipin synthase [Costertonia aggregata]QLG44995.1 cardiolipin synthase [Costertonia aggregata]